MLDPLLDRVWVRRCQYINICIPDMPYLKSYIHQNWPWPLLSSSVYFVRCIGIRGPMFPHFVMKLLISFIFCQHCDVDCRNRNAGMFPSEKDLPSSAPKWPSQIAWKHRKYFQSQGPSDDLMGSIFLWAPSVRYPSSVQRRTKTSDFTQTTALLSRGLNCRVGLLRPVQFAYQSSRIVPTQFLTNFRWLGITMVQ